jgi:SMP-30/Gluconolactonase/LRE-like region
MRKRISRPPTNFTHNIGPDRSRSPTRRLSSPRRERQKRWSRMYALRRFAPMRWSRPPHERGHVRADYSQRRLLVGCVLSAALIPQIGFAQRTSSPPNSVSPETAMRRAEIQKVEESLAKIADRGAGLFFLARRYAQVGDLDKALSTLKECVRLDLGFDPGDLPQFERLRSNPEFQAMVEQVRRRYPPVHRSHVAFTISETDLFPEGLAADADWHVFYMGSVKQKIIRITDDGKVSDFANSNTYQFPELNGIKVDPKDHGLWVASADDHKSELLHFDSQGKLLEHFPPPDGGRHALNDLVLHGSNDVYVSDIWAHEVYRFDRGKRTLTPLSFHRPLLYPNGIALSNDRKFLYVADILGVIQVDLGKNQTQEVGPGKHNTLAGIDGLYWYKGSLVGVQYGNGPYRVARWRLSPDGLKVVSTDVFEYRTPLISFPTTGAILGGKFYFIANTGIANYKDGKVVNPSKLEPINIAVLALE